MILPLSCVSVDRYHYDIIFMISLNSYLFIHCFTCLCKPRRGGGLKLLAHVFSLKLVGLFFYTIRYLMVRKVRKQYLYAKGTQDHMFPETKKSIE